ncbi:hypothetical protein LWI29_007991 [Acer saccharum]|uniref:TF-B3 domain-containing protein n=1 Tax=Acer saccharum TaxID=4024 RepID=A0AA39SUW0_ACESA|nr:hypothetical protein LWI29_007991 [Acer saccharum]
MEKGMAMGFDFNGRKEELMEIMARRKDGNDNRHFLDLMAADIWGQQWPLRYYTRPNGSKICPVFTTGWNQYVDAKGVRVGDQLIFSGHQVAGADGELEMRYMIRVTRPGPVTFNGEPVPLDVEYLA